jgi:selenocysteine lyase/cysteine desulfurase
MLTCKHSQFTLPPKVTFLNCSYLSPLLKSVEKAGIRGLRQKRNPGLVAPEDFFAPGELLREEFSRVINVRDPKRVAIVNSVSYGMASVAKNLKISRGQHILVAAEQFPSNYYPWQRLCEDTGAEMKVVDPPQTPEGRGKIWNEKILQAITKDTRAVAIANTHWADGTKFDLEAIRKRTNDIGALLIVDGTQSVGAMPFDAARIKPDALVCAGYKWLLGPYGIGFAYYGEYFDNGKPVEESWLNRLNSEDFTKLVNYEQEYQPGALRYDAGEHGNFILVPMMMRALEQINRWKVSNIQEYCSSITAGAVKTLREKGFWIEDENYRGGHLFGIRLPEGMNMDKVKDSFRKNKIYVSFRGNAIRVAPNVYNDEKDLQKLVSVLSRVR